MTQYSGMSNCERLEEDDESNINEDFRLKNAYNYLNLSQLKEELKKRNLKQAKTKKECREILLSADQNQNQNSERENINLSQSTVDMCLQNRLDEWFASHESTLMKKRKICA